MARQSFEKGEDTNNIWWGAAVIGTVILIALWLSIFTINQYERGVVTRQGAFHRIAEPGWNTKIPFIDGLNVIDTRVRSPKIEDMESFSADKQEAKLDVSVTFEPRIDRIKELYNKYKTIDYAFSELIKPYIPTHVKIVFGRYTSTKAIQERGKLNSDVKDALMYALGSDSVFNIISVNIEDVDFSKEYRRSVEDNMKAEIKVLEAKNNWESEKITAEINKTQADAVAYGIKIKGDAEAAAVDSIGKALAQNPSYIDKMIAERYKGEVPQNFTILPNNATPFLQLPNLKKN